MASITRDILTIQVSTIVSESVFSLSSRILSVRRTRLKPESVESCICLKDYLYGPDRIQNQLDLEAEIEMVEENPEENAIDQGLSSTPLTDTDVGNVDPALIRLDKVIMIIFYLVLDA